MEKVLSEATVGVCWDGRTQWFYAEAETYYDALKQAYEYACEYMDKVAKEENGWCELDFWSEEQLEEYGII